MPFILDSRPNRRTFLTRTGSALVGLAAIRPGMAQGQAAAGGAAPVRLALLSDTHIPADPTEAYRNFRPVDNLRTVAAQVARADVSGCLIAGDLARLTGRPEDYTALGDLLRPITDRRPVGLLLGNHDHRANFLRAFPESAGTRQSVNNKHVMVIEQGGQRFVLLDSLLSPNVTPGQLGNAQRAWLKEFLGAAAPLPTVLFVHHTLDDNDGALVDSDRLFEVLRPAGHVKAVVFGHSHRYHVGERDGIQLINLPAVGYNFADTEPVGWLESSWTAAGVDLTLRAVGGNQAEQGQTRTVRWLR